MQDQAFAKKFDNLNREQFEALLTLSRQLNTPEYSDGLIEEALDLVIRVLNAERGLFVRCKKDENKLIAARNVQQNDIQDISSFSSGILNKVIEGGSPQLYHDIPNDPTVSQFQSVQINQIKSVIGVPVFLNDRIWGAIVVDSVRDRTLFTNESLEFLEFFSNLLSLSLDKIRTLEHLQDENRVLRKQLESQSIPDMVGDSPAMKRVGNLIHRVAQTNATVLLLGESGTGKDLAARAIHTLSERKDQTFVAQFCGSIPDTLLESELFGYKRGAFSGAVRDKKGLFEVASGGTFFLDEIGDISAATQAKLLRVLNNNEIIRLGDTQVKQVDCRIIAATNQDLQKLVSDGAFRQDLYYRLNVFPITLPALREHKEDILPLVEHFIEKKNRDITISGPAMKKLQSYHWPGNVRQLENVLKRAFILCDDNVLKPELLMLEEQNNEDQFSGSLKEIERIVLRQRLEKFENNRTKTAESLGVSIRWVQLRLKEMQS